MRALTAGRQSRHPGGASERTNVQGDFWLRGDVESGQGIIKKSHKFDQTNFAFLCCGHTKCVKSNHFCTSAPRLPGIRHERQVKTITYGPVGTNPSSPHQFHAHFWYPALSTELFKKNYYLLMATRHGSQTFIIKVTRSHSAKVSAFLIRFQATLSEPSAPFRGTKKSVMKGRRGRSVDYLCHAE